MVTVFITVLHQEIQLLQKVEHIKSRETNILHLKILIGHICKRQKIIENFLNVELQTVLKIMLPNMCFHEIINSVGH